MRKRAVDPRLGARVAELRCRRHITQRELAHVLGVTDGLIGHYEHGRVAVPADRLVEIARALRCPLSDLIDEPGGHQ